MNPTIGNAATGIVAVNSCDFVARAIECLNNGEAFVTLRDETDTERTHLFGDMSVYLPVSDFGWLGALSYSPLDDHSIGQVCFTSGTEGQPKAILISHAALGNTTERLVDAMKLNSSIREYVGVPVYYSFGFGRCRAVLQAGGDAYIPEHGFDPLEIAAMLKSGEINAISAVPSLLRIVLQNQDLFSDVASDVRWIEIGSQYMSAAEKIQLRGMFPEARIVQHYGLTEASRTTFLDISNSSEEQLESVGQPSRDVKVTLNADGKIMIRGPHLASSVLEEKHRQTSLVDEDGWFTTNDIGHIDKGYLYFEGRADDVINSGGIKISPDHLELQLRKALQITEGLSVAKVPDSMRGESVLIAYQNSIDADALRVAAISELKKLGLESGQSLKIMPVESFPVTETGKVKRSVLAQNFTEFDREQAQVRNTQPMDENASAENPRITELVALWEEVLQIAPVSPNDSFFDLGGDSLSAITVAIRMEKFGIAKEVSRQIFEGKTIAELVDTSDQSRLKQPIAAASQSIDAVRGMLALFVVASHWMPGVIERVPGVSEANKLFSFFYSAGTPGFAIIFGVGIGFAYLPRFERSRLSVNTLVRRNVVLLLGGVVFLAFVKILAGILGGKDMSPVDYSNTFYGVLTYYMLAVLSIPMWLSFLKRRNSIILSSLMLAMVSYLVHELILLWNPGPSTNPIIQTVLLLLTAKFNYFEISAGVLGGLAVGHWLRGVVSEQKNTGKSLQIGLVLMLLGFVLSIKFEHLDFWVIWPKPIFVWMWVLYAGFVLACIHGMFKLSMAGSLNRFSDLLLKGLSIFGILAFPLFIGHELVIPLKDLLQAVNIPLALPIAMTIFVASVTYLLVRVHKIYYSSND